MPLLFCQIQLLDLYIVTTNHYYYQRLNTLFFSYANINKTTILVIIAKIHISPFLFQKNGKKTAHPFGCAVFI